MTERDRLTNRLPVTTNAAAIVKEAIEREREIANIDTRERLRIANSVVYGNAQCDRQEAGTPRALRLPDVNG